MEGTNEEVLSANTRNEYVEAIKIEDFFECGKLLPPAIRNFQSQEELLKYVPVSLSQVYATTIRDSKKDKYVTIGCDRRGINRNRMNTPVEEQKRKTSSKLIDCLFRIKGMKLSDGSWTNPNLKAISKTVYNTKAMMPKQELGGRTPIQSLLNELLMM
ncbi:hypothetical protein FRX31_033039 [Thalictrum thalictroides]|uniref:Uncharacterized protein n=1 Tax=Thalictrum thalictroides TaxID=46969 RepID=A0A7J6UXM8_THATH|nr:hypothetical protein FRX31_033039 [Thalictrum thalictroides]